MRELDSSPALYRSSVGVMLFNKAGKIFIAKRKDLSADSPYSWQMPQGGIESDETLEHAALRELEEEIGTADASIVAVSPQLFKYDLPQPLREKSWEGRYRGQEQRWILMRFEGSDRDINLATTHPEFIEWRWAEIEELEQLVVPFKKEIYAAVVREFRPYIIDAIEIF